MSLDASVGDNLQAIAKCLGRNVRDLVVTVLDRDRHKQLIDDINAFQSTPVGTPESNAIGARMVENMTSNLLFLGTVLSSGPIYHRNALKNFPEFRTESYEYYRTYPYRAAQWYFDE